MKFAEGQHVAYRGSAWTILRTSDTEPAVLCKEGHPPKHGGKTNWFHSDELRPVPASTADRQEGFQG